MEKEITFNNIKKGAFRVTGRTVQIKASENASEVMSVKFDPEGKTVAVGNFDGSLKLYSANTGKIIATLNAPPAASEDGVPVTCVRWRPQFTAGGNVRASSVLCSTLSDGSIQHWHLQNYKITHDEKHHVGIQNHLMALDYTRDGKKYAVAGVNSNVYVYDDHTREIAYTMHSKGLKIYGHRNRILSVKCHPDDENLIITAGWDNTVKIYDLRDKAPVGSMRGPLLGGDSIDVFEDLIVSGSNRNKETMQIFSIS